MNRLFIAARSFSISMDAMAHFGQTEVRPIPRSRKPGIGPGALSFHKIGQLVVFDW